jgi:hypothetical protein
VYNRTLAGGEGVPGCTPTLLNFSKYSPSLNKAYLLNRVFGITEFLVEENGLRVFDNRVLRRIFGLKRDEVTGG